VCSSIKISFSANIDTFQVIKNLNKLSAKGVLMIPLITIQNNFTYFIEDLFFDFKGVNLRTIVCVTCA